MKRHEKKDESTLRRVNNLLSGLVILLSIYILATPFVPELLFWWRTKSGQPALVRAENTGNKVSYPNENTLVIPSLGLQELVHEGPGEAVLAQGVWRRPHTSTPDKSGNTVMAGHRFTYSEPAVFYHLDKIKIGDEIIIYWESQKYTYKVSNISEVTPDAARVEGQTGENKLTLYTCTPLWTSKNRLVVEARLLEDS